MKIQSSTLRDIKYYTIIGTAALVFTAAVLLLGHLGALLLGTTL